MPNESSHILTSPARRGWCAATVDSKLLARALAIATLAGLLAELLGEKIVPRHGLFHELMETAILLILALPPLYYFFALPLRQVNKEETAEMEALQGLYHDLDSQLRERNIQLDTLIKSASIQANH